MVNQKATSYRVHDLDTVYAVHLVNIKFGELANWRAFSLANRVNKN